MQWTNHFDASLLCQMVWLKNQWVVHHLPRMMYHCPPRTIIPRMMVHHYAHQQYCCSIRCIEGGPLWGDALASHTDTNDTISSSTNRVCTASAEGRKVRKVSWRSELLFAYPGENLCSCYGSPWIYTCSSAVIRLNHVALLVIRFFFW